MRIHKKTDSAAELYTMLQEAAQNHAFNITADLRELQKQHGRLNKTQFKKVLAALAEKYTDGVYPIAFEALTKKIRDGDIAAIRLYHELQRDGGGAGGEEVQIIDDL